MQSSDLESFKQAVAQAQAGHKVEANALLTRLRTIYPNEPNLLLWLAFTSFDLTEAKELLIRVGQLDPNNPQLQGAREWLIQQERTTKATTTYGSAPGMTDPRQPSSLEVVTTENEAKPKGKFKAKKEKVTSTEPSLPPLNLPSLARPPLEKLKVHEGEGGLSVLTRWALKRRSAILLICLLVLFFGIFTITQLKSELYPNIEVPYLIISTAYPGASSDDVTNQVSIPLENVVSQMPRLKSLRSTSLESFSLIFSEFEFGTNLSDVEQKLTGKLRGLNLPTGPGGTPLQPTISNFTISSIPVMYLTVEGLKGQSSEALSKWTRQVAFPAFTKVTDVSKVEVIGDVSQLVTINFKPEDLTAKGLSLNDVLNALRSTSLSFPAGSVQLSGKNVPIRTAYAFGNVDELGNLLLMPSISLGDTPPTPVRLKDVAELNFITAATGGLSRTNGKPGLQLQVFKSQNGNTVTVSDGVGSKLEELNKQYPDIKLGVVYDQATQVRQSIEGLVREGLLGALFAVLVIFVFLRNVRSTLVTAISIPTSVIVAFILLWNQGITLNIMTLGGLAVAIGRVVDDAIVVLENIFRHVQEGDPLPVAVQSGTQEVAGAITSSTLTTVAVFLPLAFTGGIIGQFFLPFALTVTFALLASLLVALTIIPVFASYFINHKVVGDEKENTLIQRIYTPVLRWSLKHRVLTLLLAFILLLGSFASVGIFKVPFALLPEGSDKLLSVTIEVAPGSGQEVAVEATDKVEKILDEYRSSGIITLYQTSIAGESNSAQAQRAVTGSSATTDILIRLIPSAKTNEVAKQLREKLQAVTPTDGKIVVALPGGTTSNVFSVVVQGLTPDAVRQASTNLIESLKSIDKLVNVSSDVTALTPQIVVTPDPTKNPLANTALIGGQLRNLLQGQSAGTIRFADGQQADLILLLPKPDGGNVGDYIASLKELQVFPNVKLGDLAKVEEVEASTQTTRINQSLAATVKADITVEDVGGVTTEALQKVKDTALPDGITVTLAGAGQQQQEAFLGLGIAMLAAIALVYIVLVIAFGSLLEPFAILFSLPLAIIGALLALVITQRALGLPAMIGMLMLIGIVVTNAIVLIDLVNQLRKQGYERNEALIIGGRTRLRPILMTAVATILALMPLALGFSEGAIIAAELGTVVIGGLFTSTLLTLVVVPVVYSLLEGLKGRLGIVQNRGL
ncbi:MAG: efflux RND transporter permease subunit [Chloroflexi bacterium]|nr:efflux RND transporter permease subunit [Chloroflexota bacterium]